MSENKPYENPKSTTEQLVNLSWRIARELRAVYNTAKARITQEDADARYLGKAAKAVSSETADSAAKATQDAQGRVIDSTYLTKSDAANTYLGKGAKAVSASAADTATSAEAADVATKAEQDAQGRVIADTYALKTDIPTVPKQVQADWAATSTSSTAYIKNKPGAIKVGGSLGLVQSPATNEPNHVLKADGSWGDATTYAKESTATSGYIAVREAKGAYGAPVVSEKLKVNPKTGDIQVGKVNGVDVSSLVTTTALASGLAGKLDTTVAADTYLTKIGNAASATKATQDGNGKVISSTYATKTNMKAATASAAGTAGLVPAPAAGAQGKFLRGDGTWQTPTNTTYSAMKAATASAAGTAGLVPAPAAGAQGKFLRGDGTWWGAASIETLSDKPASSITQTGFYSLSGAKKTLGVPEDTGTLLHVQRAWPAGAKATQLFFSSSGKPYTRLGTDDGNGGTTFGDWYPLVRSGAVDTLVTAVNPGSYLNAAKGNAIIASSLADGDFVPLWTYNHTNGSSSVLCGHKDALQISNVSKENKDSGTNKSTLIATLTSDGNLTVNGLMRFTGALQNKGSTRTDNVITVDDGTKDGSACYYGGAGGLTAICSGESAAALRSHLDDYGWSPATEQTVIASDGAISLVTNANTWDDRIDHEIQAQGFDTKPKSLVKGATPTTVTYTHHFLCEGAGRFAANRLAGFEAYAHANGSTGFTIRCYKPESGSTDNSYLQVVRAADDTCTATLTGTMSATAFKATSDRRRKEDLVEITPDLSSLKAYRYTLKDDGQKHVGLIAQDVEKIIPEAVSENEKGIKSLDYNGVVAALVAEVNALKKRISTLEGEKHE